MWLDVFDLDAGLRRHVHRFFPEQLPTGNPLDERVKKWNSEPSVRSYPLDRSMMKARCSRPKRAVFPEQQLSDRDQKGDIDHVADSESVAIADRFPGGP